MQWQTIQDVIGTIFTLVGIPVIGGGLIYIGRKLQIIDTIQNNVTNRIEPELKDLKERFVVVEDRIETIWEDQLAPVHSPRQLNDRGKNILEQSGIKQIVDAKKDFLTKLVKDKGATNPYDAENIIGDVMRTLPDHFPEMIDPLKEGAFKVGANLDAVLYVGSIYLRNQIFKDLGFSLHELDGHEDESSSLSEEI